MKSDDLEVSSVCLTPARLEQELLTTDINFVFILVEAILDTSCHEV